MLFDNSAFTHLTSKTHAHTHTHASERSLCARASCHIVERCVAEICLTHSIPWCHPRALPKKELNYIQYIFFSIAAPFFRCGFLQVRYRKKNIYIPYFCSFFGNASQNRRLMPGANWNFLANFHSGHLETLFLNHYKRALCQELFHQFKTAYKTIQISFNAFNMNFLQHALIVTILTAMVVSQTHACSMRKRQS